jgi:hypothetical protein
MYDSNLHYVRRERLEDIRMLKLKINDLKRKLHMLKQQTSNIDVLRNEVYHLQVRYDWHTRATNCAHLLRKNMIHVNIHVNTHALARARTRTLIMNACTRTQRELLSERTKVKALSEELENPMNVHRWRKLEGSDPGTLEMIQKIQTLQKRLIAKTGELPAQC